MSRALATEIPAATPTMVDDLSVLLPDWSTHLRARNVAPSTIASYLRVGENLLTYLRESGRPTTVSAINRDLDDRRSVRDVRPLMIFCHVAHDGGGVRSTGRLLNGGSTLCAGT